MRTCMDGCERLQAADVSSGCLKAEYVMLSGYCLYGPGFTKQVIARASEVCELGGSKVRMAACFEMKGELWPSFIIVASNTAVPLLGQPSPATFFPCLSLGVRLWPVTLL